MQEAACREPCERTVLRTEDLPFSRVPGQSKLFLQYLSDPISLLKYYPSAVSDTFELVSRREEVLANHRVDRYAICEVLMDQNSAFGGGPAAAANILKLKQADCVAVLTGQQAGLFTGPLYTIYKALSAVRVSEYLDRQGVKTVPVFWIATEDHDFEEVSSALAIGADGQMAEARIDVAGPDRGKPVGKIALDGSIDSVISKWVDSLPRAVSRPELENILKTAYASGADFGLAFGKTLALLFERYGLVVVDPLDERLKQFSSPIVKRAVENSEEIVAALRSRSKELETDGYHAQVLAGEDYFPLFWIGDDGMRRPIRKGGYGKFRIAGNKRESTLKELSVAAESEPARFSAGVMLRPIVQDHLFPTICYIGGGAEIAYFAQNSEVYKILERPVTPILHRQSFTIVEPKQSRTMKKYGLNFEDVFRGFDALRSEIVKSVIDPATPLVLAEVEEKINSELNRLDRQLSKIDPTLSGNLATRRRKIVYHIAALRKKFERVRLEKDHVANRRLHELLDALYPNGGLQERTLNFAQYVNLFGPQFIDWVHDSIDVENKGHRILFL